MAFRRQEDVMREFINVYRSYSCIWKVKSSEYMDRNKRENAYKALVNILKQINPDADTDMVKKKINSMRSCFRKEYKKVMDSKRSGTGAENIYTPTLWYFELLLFLKDQETPRSSIGTDETNFLTSLETVNTSDNDDETDIQSPSALEDMPPTPSSYASVDNPATPASSASVSTRSSLIRSRREKKRKMDGDNVLQIVGEKLQQSRLEDEFDIIGRNVAEKLRRLDRTVSLFAEKIINDTLFEAQMGTLNVNSYAVTERKNINREVHSSQLNMTELTSRPQYYSNQANLTEVTAIRRHQDSNQANMTELTATPQYINQASPLQADTQWGSIANLSAGQYISQFSVNNK